MVFEGVTSDIDKDVVDLVRNLSNSGYETYIVGGAVRDLLLGIKPKDYDVATCATPEQVKALFKNKCRIIGKRFRIVHYYAGKKIIEVSTFRREPSAEERYVHVKGRIRFNENSYGSAYEDAWRRDFTVNAIFFDPLQGKIIDHTSMGVKDLCDGIVRTIGKAEERFNEDPVRILRGLKLAGQYLFRIEPETQDAINNNMHLIRNASMPRLTFEIEKILKSVYSARIILKFYESFFLDILLPNLAKELRIDDEKRRFFFELLEEWNLRNSQGLSCASFSSSIAVFLLPFCFDKIFEVRHCGMSKSRLQMERELAEIAFNILHPYRFPKKVMNFSREIMMMQAVLLRQMRSAKIMHHIRLREALELFKVLNKVKWKDTDLETKWS